MNPSTKLRSEDDLSVEQFTFFSNRAKRFKNGTKILDSELEYMAPEGELDGDVLNFNLAAKSYQNISFMDEYQLRVEARFTCTLQNYTDEDFATTSGGVVTETLVPS